MNTSALVSTLRGVGLFMVILWIVFGFGCLLEAMAARAARRRERERKAAEADKRDRAIYERGGETAGLYATHPVGPDAFVRYPVGRTIRSGKPCRLGPDGLLYELPEDWPEPIEPTIAAALDVEPQPEPVMTNAWAALPREGAMPRWEDVLPAAPVMAHVILNESGPGPQAAGALFAAEEPCRAVGPTPDPFPVVPGSDPSPASDPDPAPSYDPPSSSYDPPSGGGDPVNGGGFILRCKNGLVERVERLDGTRDDSIYLVNLRVGAGLHDVQLDVVRRNTEHSFPFMPCVESVTGRRLTFTLTVGEEPAEELGTPPPPEEPVS